MVQKLKEFLRAMHNRFAHVRENKKIMLLLVLSLIIVAFSAVSIALIYYTRIIPSIGEIRVYGVGIYWDSNCNTGVESLDWGIAEPGLTKSETVYIRNEGNAPTILYLDTTDWYPQEASNYITLGWDYSGETVEPNQIIKVILTLSISPNIEEITTFTFGIIISQS